MKLPDERVAYGIFCTWWGGIEEVGRIPGTTIPGCPHCGRGLFEQPDLKTWWNGVAQYEANGHAGYRSFIEWSKGKCFANRYVAKAAYEAKPSRKAGF